MVEQNLSIAAIQTQLVWENPTANLLQLGEKLASIHKPVDLILLPEMFATGFTMQPQLFAAKMNGEEVRWMQQWAKEKNAVVCGSLAVEENGKYYNRLFWVNPNGVIQTYDKRHLFRMAKEHESYTGGTQRIIKEWKGWRICPLICYDLRFPVWARNVNLEYDLLLYIANWPSIRRQVWNTLLQARAIENLSYVIGVNRVGEDANGLPYSGDSALIDFKGEILLRKSEEEGIYVYTLQKESLTTFRERFPAYLDADEFSIQTE